jgi:hypothetical protein
MPATTADLTALKERYQREAAERSGEHAAVAVFLAGSRLVGDHRFTRHADARGIDWAAITEDGTWSPGELMILRTAASLFKSGGHEISVGRAAGFLDDDGFALFMAMIQARRTAVIPEQYR